MPKIKIGAAFSDSIYQHKPSLLKPRRSDKYNSDDEPKPRNFLLPLLFVTTLLILGGRLFYLQIIKGSFYQLRSDTQRTRTTIIFDRNNKPLVFNTPGFRRVTKDKTELLDSKTGIELLAKGDKQIEIDSLRSYPFKDSMAHVLGYIGQISQAELSEDKEYTVGDVIGKMGIEQEYEKLLKGVNGEKLVEVNASQNIVRTLGQTDPVPGQNITLSIDSDMQQAVSTAMKDVKKGAAILSKPNGEVLAMVSKPSFDPNLFTLGNHYTTASDSAYHNISSVLLDNQNQPLLNRSIAGVYPPGSTFKLLTAAAGLETKKIDKNYTVEDNGILKVGDFSFANWYYSEYGKTEGTVDIVKAIKRSNDIFFYKLGEVLGVDSISQEAAKFGVGSTLGIDLLGEHTGLLPTQAWKEKTFHEKWFLGDDYHYAIGQGYLLTTPLQVNAWTQAIANEGTLYKPHLLLSQKSEILSKNLLQKDNFTLIRQGMIEACQTGGVAWPLFNFSVKNKALRSKIDNKNFFIPPVATGSAAPTNDQVGVSIACKTGTAQHGTEDTLPHSWITLFAPAYNPQIVLTVLSESSGEGSNVAGPIAEKILQNYFEK